MRAARKEERDPGCGLSRCVVVQRGAGEDFVGEVFSCRFPPKCLKR